MADSCGEGATPGAFEELATCRATVFLAVVLLAVGCGDSPPGRSGEVSMFRGGPEHTGVYPGGGVSGFSGVRWRFEAGGAIRSSPTVADGTVIVGSSDGRIYAVDEGTGAERWSFDANSPINSTPAVAGGLVFFADRAGVFRAVDQSTGSLRWTFASDPELPLPWGNEGWDYYTSSPTTVEDLVLFGGGDGLLYALEAGSGREVWRYATDGRIRSSPAVSGGTVFVGSADGSLHAVSLADGRGLWRYDTEGRSLDSEAAGFDRRSIQSSPAVQDGRVVFGSRDGHLYSVEIETGEMAWRFDHQVSWCITSPAISKGVVYAGSSDGLFVQAIDGDTGEELWRTATGHRVFASPAVSGPTVLIGDHGGILRALHAETGAELWRVMTGGPIQSSPVVSEGRVFVGSDDGLLYAIDGTDGPSSRRAVHWDEEIQPLYQGHEEIRDHLSSSGFEVLDSDALASFMSARIGDRTPSAVVFAMGDVPGAVAPVVADTVLFRRYLDSGGRVVWVGYPPFVLVRDSASGAITGVDMNRAEDVLGVDHAQATGDEYPAWPTPEGRRWGLSGTWIDAFGVEPEEVDIPLALDERGRASAWVQHYGGEGGGALVRLWSGGDPASIPPLLRGVAEFGLGAGVDRRSSVAR
jgi:outer membrane protein assembly factor BamB